MRLNLSRARWSAASLLLAALGFGAPLAAQSDGDKAAARRLAQDAIVAYRAERYEEALDKAQRAQALYDAPVHLLYMARALVKLGRLVEAAETYRTLGRLQLPANAPAPFREAIETAPVELAAFEAKIPLLRIEVSPAGAPGLELWLDGQPVSSALLGLVSVVLGVEYLRRYDFAQARRATKRKRGPNLSIGAPSLARQRPTLPHGIRAVPSAQESLTSEFEMGSGMASLT